MSKKKNDVEVTAMPSTNMQRKSVTIRKVVNGFVVDVSQSKNGDWKEQTFIAADKKSAEAISNKALS
jgi:hypothetical protein